MDDFCWFFFYIYQPRLFGFKFVVKLIRQLLGEPFLVFSRMRRIVTCFDYLLMRVRRHIAKYFLNARLLGLERFLVLEAQLLIRFVIRFLIRFVIRSVIRQRAAYNQNLLAHWLATAK